MLEAGIQTLPHSLLQQLLVKPCCCPVDRNDAARNGALRFGLFIYGICKSTPSGLEFYTPIKYIAFSAMQIILGIGLIEISYVNRPAVVHSSQLDDIQAAKGKGLDIFINALTLGANAHLLQAVDQILYRQGVVFVGLFQKDLLQSQKLGLLADIAGHTITSLI